MNDSTITILLLGGCLLLVTLLLSALLLMGSRLMLKLLNYQTLENQRLRNLILANGDLSALDHLNRTTEVQRDQAPLNSETVKPGIDPQDIINTNSGPQVVIDGVPVPLQALDPSLLAQGWDDDADVDFSLSPEGGYVPGPGN